MWFIKFLGQPDFRNENGDMTTEVGYEEDSVGHIRHEYRLASQDEIDDPHMAVERFVQ